MLTELVQNENTSPSVQGRALENGFVWTGDRKDSLHTPLAIGWFFLEEIGWLWTNPSTYPHVYCFGQNDQTSSWLYFKEGSTPPRYYDFALGYGLKSLSRYCKSSIYKTHELYQHITIC